MPVKIFLSCCHAAAKMTLRLVDIKNLANILSKNMIDSGKPLRHILVNCALADSEAGCGLPHGGFAVNYVLRYRNCSFLNISFQCIPPSKWFVQCMKGLSQICKNYNMALIESSGRFAKSINSPSHIIEGRDLRVSLIRTTSPMRPSESLTLV